jgi:hypothetical protein
MHIPEDPIVDQAAAMRRMRDLLRKVAEQAAARELTASSDREGIIARRAAEEGSPGSAGMNGRDGWCEGAAGGEGGDGGQAGDGPDGLSVTVRISGNGPDIALDTDQPIVAFRWPIPDGGSLRIHAEGASGGDGGDGGHGGAGRHGTEGAAGEDRDDLSRKDGGDGGRGGDGSNGGNGGKGGRGGDGGRGGKIEVYAEEPWQLLALDEVRIHPGCGGRGGRAGSAGHGGHGGWGGRGGRQGGGQSSAKPGEPGKNGKAGSPGTPGQAGMPGRPGKAGTLEMYVGKGKNRKKLTRTYGGTLECRLSGCDGPIIDGRSSVIHPSAAVVHLDAHWIPHEGAARWLDRLLGTDRPGQRPFEPGSQVQPILKNVPAKVAESWAKAVRTAGIETAYRDASDPDTVDFNPPPVPDGSHWLKFDQGRAALIGRSARPDVVAGADYTLEVDWKPTGPEDFPLEVELAWSIDGRDAQVIGTVPAGAADGSIHRLRSTIRIPATSPFGPCRLSVTAMARRDNLRWTRVASLHLEIVAPITVLAVAHPDRHGALKPTVPVIVELARTRSLELAASPGDAEGVRVSVSGSLAPRDDAHEVDAVTVDAPIAQPGRAETVELLVPFRPFASKSAALIDFGKHSLAPAIFGRVRLKIQIGSVTRTVEIPFRVYPEAPVSFAFASDYLLGLGGEVQLAFAPDGDLGDRADPALPWQVECQVQRMPNLDPQPLPHAARVETGKADIVLPAELLDASVKKEGAPKNIRLEVSARPPYGKSLPAWTGELTMAVHAPIDIEHVDVKANRTPFDPLRFSLLVNHRPTATVPDPSRFGIRLTLPKGSLESHGDSRMLELTAGKLAGSLNSGIERHDFSFRLLEPTSTVEMTLETVAGDAGVVHRSTVRVPRCECPFRIDGVPVVAHDHGEGFRIFTRLAPLESVDPSMDLKACRVLPACRRNAVSTDERDAQTDLGGEGDLQPVQGGWIVSMPFTPGDRYHEFLCSIIQVRWKDQAWILTSATFEWKRTSTPQPPTLPFPVATPAPPLAPLPTHAAASVLATEASVHVARIREAILSILLGGFWVQKFFVADKRIAAALLVLTVLIPPLFLVSGLYGLVDGVRLLFMSDERYRRDRQRPNRRW